jgi:hypothetical protein
MRWRRAARNGAKWAGLVTVAVIVAVYVASAWWSAWLTDAASMRSAGITAGAIFVQSNTGAATGGYVPPPGLHARREPPRSGIVADFIWLPMPAGGASFAGAVVPLWIPLIIVAAPTCLIWRADRRAARLAMVGRCSKCGYDHHSLAADTKCPECGAAPTPTLPVK